MLNYVIIRNNSAKLEPIRTKFHLAEARRSSGDFWPPWFNVGKNLFWRTFVTDTTRRILHFSPNTIRGLTSPLCYDYFKPVMLSLGLGLALSDLGLDLELRSCQQCCKTARLIGDYLHHKSQRPVKHSSWELFQTCFHEARYVMLTMNYINSKQ